MAIETCTACHKSFDVAHVGAGMICGAEREAVICPYCEHEVRYERTTGSFWTRKLEDLGGGQTINKGSK